MSGSENNSKILQKHQHVTSKHNTEQSKTQTRWKTFCFNDTNDTNQKKKKRKNENKWQTSLREKDSSVS